MWLAARALVSLKTPPDGRKRECWPKDHGLAAALLPFDVMWERCMQKPRFTEHTAAKCLRQSADITKSWGVPRITRFTTACVRQASACALTRQSFRISMSAAA